MRTQRRGEELAFLPAALEIVETPPSPIGRTIGATIILLFCAALVWAWWGTIDIVASATGKIVPSGRTKVIQPFETGVVRSIRVQDGQAVKAGDVLIELDPTVNAAERDHLRNDLLAEQLNIARLRAALAGGDDPVADFTPPADADPALISTQRQLLLNQVTEHRAKIAALARQQAQKEAEQATTAATIHKLETMIPVIQPRVDIRKTLMDKELGSKLTYFEILQLLVEQQEELSVQKSHLHEAEAAVAAIWRDARPGGGRISAYTLRRTRQGRAEGERAHPGPDQGRAEDQASAADRSRGRRGAAARDPHGRRRCHACAVPAGGRTERQPAGNRGHGVEPRHRLCPPRARSRDQDRHLQFHPLRPPCTARCSASRRTPSSATGKQDRSDDRALGTQNDTSEPKGQELNYSARISLDRTQMQIDDRMVNLSPGMAVTVEIKTGSRTMLSYLLSPLLRYRQETLRER